MGNVIDWSLTLRIFEWAGSLLGLLGAYLLATDSRVSRYGWLAFFGANIAMIVFAVGIHAYGLLAQQVGFTGSSVLGLYRTGLLRPLTGWLVINKQRRGQADESL